MNNRTPSEFSHAWIINIFEHYQVSKFSNYFIKWNDDRSQFLLSSNITNGKARLEIYFDEWKTLGGVKFEFRAVIRSALASLVLYRQTYVLLILEWPVLVGSFEFDIWKSKINKNVYKHRQPQSRKVKKSKNFQFFIWNNYSIKITSAKIVKVS
jgi:hypothetical protein